MYVLPPVVIVLALSGALYMFNEVWSTTDYDAGDATQAQRFQRAYGTRAQLSAREKMQGRSVDPETGIPAPWMGAAQQGVGAGSDVPRSGGFQYGSGGAGREPGNPLDTY